MTADSVKMTADSVKVDPVDHLRHSFNTCDTPSTPATQHLEFVKSVAMETMPLAKGTSCTRLLMIWPGVASCYICGCCLLHLWLLLATSVVASCYILRMARASGCCSCFRQPLLLFVHRTRTTFACPPGMGKEGVAAF